MIKLYTFLFLFAALPALGQSEFKNYLNDHISAIRSIDPADTVYADLQVIENAIGDARVVMLGEQDHGDAPTFLAKTRLIKYLHEKMGFDVLAFESDFFALNEGWDKLIKQKDSITQFLRRNIFSLWTNCIQCEDLFFNYIPESHQSTSPLQISGFDNQNNGRYSKLYLRNFIDSYLKKKQPAFINSPLYQSVFLKFLEEPYHFDRNLGNDQFVLLEQIADTILNQVDDPTNEFELLVLKSLKAFFKGRYTKSDNKVSYQIRDLQMGNNLDWIINKKFAGRKVIIWAANYHIMKNATDVFERDFNKRLTMGEVFTEIPGNAEQTYILGFTSRQGTAGRLYKPVYALAPLIPNSFEGWVDKDLHYGFIDFNSFNKAVPRFDTPFYMRAHWGDQLADWTKVFDGVFYIRDMYPCQERK